jgi:ABC-2 family transporter protein
MFRAMLWKELREQAAILIALLALGSGVIATAAALGSSAGLEAGLGDFRAYTNAGRLAVLALTIAAGVVIGGSLFAGEIENETMGCLEMLPARRWSIWWSKLAAGLALTAIAAAVLLGMGVSLGALGGQTRRVWIVAGSLLTFIAFAWGTFGSTVARSTLGACAGGLFGSVAFGVPIFSVALVALQSLVQVLFDEPPLLLLQLEPVVAAYAVVLAPIVLGGIVFTAPDRARYLFKPKDEKSIRVRAASTAPGRLRVAFWLARRQWAIAFAVGSTLALGLGLAALIEEAHLLVGWPLAACFAGVCGGVLAWTDEQSRETFKYWGERRLPPGWPWAIKIASSFAVAFAWVLLLFLPVFVRAVARERHDETPRFIEAFGRGILGDRANDLAKFMLVWPLYGFAFGHLAGLLFRKTIVAIGVGLLVAAPLAAFWLPSLVIGGVHWWQLWPLPIVVLLATRWLVRPWAADRLATARPLGTLAGLAVACVAFLAFGLSWRVFEVPATAEIDDDIHFAETVPQLDSEDGGRLFRSAASSGLTRGFSDSVEPIVNGRVRFHPELGRPSRHLLSQLAMDHWPAGGLMELEPWLDREPIVEAIRQLKAVAKLPPGPIENPRVLNATTILRESLEIAPAVHVLLARGLLSQRRDRPEEFLECLEAALAVTRNARTQQPAIIHRFGFAAERPIFDALDRWLHRLEHRPDLARRARDILLRHRRDCPRDPNGATIVDRMIDRNTLNTLPLWASKELERASTGSNRDNVGFIQSPQRVKAETETEVAGFAIVVPWERERLRRVLGVKNADATSPENTNRLNTWFAGYLRMGMPATRFDTAIVESETQLELALAQTALTIFAWERGRPANALEELVPDLLPRVPVDPHALRPIGYRVSTGDTIETGRYPEDPNAPPGLAEIRLEFDWVLRQPFGGAIGGIAFADLPNSSAPGLYADGTQMVNLDCVAAVAGGLVQWPLEELPNDGMEIAMGGAATGMNGPFIGMPLRREYGSAAIDWSIRRRRLAPGQGVIWSIGPDRVDGGGVSQVGSKRDGAANAGDWLRVVPVGRVK